MNKLNIAVILCSGWACAAVAGFEPQRIEPDAFAHGTVLNQVNPYVSLITVANNNQPHPPVPFDVTAATTLAGYASTGTNVFAHAGVDFWYTDRRLRMDFAEPASQLSLDFIAGPGLLSSQGILEFYDHHNTLLRSDTTALLTPLSVETLSVTRAVPDIAWAVAYTAIDSPQQFGRLDNLQFSAVPEPAAWALLAVGAAVLALRVRRQR